MSALKFELDRRQGVLNIGYGAGSSPSFTNLTVTNTLTVGGSVHGANGSAANPSFAFNSNQNTGFYRAGTNVFTATAGGVGVMNFSRSGGGNGGRLSGTVVGNEFNLFDLGGVSLTAAGTNQNITLTPSGTGLVDVPVAGGFRLSVASAPILFRSSGSDYVGMRLTGAGTGTVEFGGGTVYAAGFKFYTASATGLWVAGSGRAFLGTETDSGALLQIGTNTTTSAGGMVFGTDVFAYRNATNSFKLEVATGTTAFTFDNGGGGTGGARIVGGAALTITSGGANSLVLQTGGTTALTLDSSQTALFAGNVSLAANKSILFGGGTISNIYSTVDGVIVVANNANTGFSRLQFGGTTSSFPALARSGVRLIARLADDSSVAELEGALVSAGAAVTVGASRIAFGGTTSATVGAAGAASPLPALPTGYIIVNVAGTNMKVPYYAN